MVSFPKRRSHWQLFWNAKQGAANRGIEFKLNYFQWLYIWRRALGANWREFCGSRRGQYGMARWGDRGAYELGNVKIILATDNTRECNTRQYNVPCINGVLSFSC
jgi:hypothetical protein